MKDTDRLSDCILEWMENYKRRSIKPSSYDRLAMSQKRLCAYSIAECQLKDISSAIIQAHVNELVEEGYSLSTIKKQYMLITAFLKFAHAEGYIDRPIYFNVKMPSKTSIKADDKCIEVYSENDQRALTEALRARRTPFGLAIMFMLKAGMRVGEVQALTWEDILWRKRAIRINKTYVRLCNEKSSYIQTGAKTQTSNRIIPISDDLMEYIQSIYSASETKTGTICLMESGEPASYSALRFHVGKYCSEAGVEYKGMHVFRHTFATNCYYNNCDVKVLSKLLGHADVNITYNTYIHLFGDELEQMRNVL